MIRAFLRQNDGLATGRVWLRSLVRRVQRALTDAGFDLEVDGLFGAQTHSAILEFQELHGLEPGEGVEQSTWDALGPHLAEAEFELPLELDRFRGDLEWLQDQEGFSGEPYWPGGVSGVTLDPGVDLGHFGSWEMLAELYRDWVSEEQLSAMRSAFGFKAEDARIVLRDSDTLQEIRITEEAVRFLMPRAAAPYWDGITTRFDPLVEDETPPSVQTVLLSLAYNRGSQNRHLESLRELLAERDWAGVAQKVSRMQQGHALLGVRVRRRHEASLIRAELEFLSAS